MTIEQAEYIENGADDLMTRGLWQEAAERYAVAADTYEEAGDSDGGRIARKEMRRMLIRIWAETVAAIPSRMIVGVFYIGAQWKREARRFRVAVKDEWPDWSPIVTIDNRGRVKRVASGA